MSEPSTDQKWAKSILNLRLPEHVDRRMRSLLDRDKEGPLNDEEREELEWLVQASEKLSSLKSKALRLPAHPHRKSYPGQTFRNGLPVVVMDKNASPLDETAVRESLEEEGF